MKLIKSFVFVFSMFSKIPMPNLRYSEDDKKYVPLAFPFVGVIVGGVTVFLTIYAMLHSWPDIANVALMIMIPLIITGGIHLDGYMDVSDALSSYADMQTKLKIMSDPHIGAFAIIQVIILTLLNVFSLSMINEPKTYLSIGFIFVISRIFSSFAMIFMKNAKGNGMLYFVSSAAHRRINIVVLIIELVVTSILMILLCDIYGLAPLISSIGCYVYYLFKAKKEFGGITGDTEGWFLVITESVAYLAIALVRISML